MAFLLPFQLFANSKTLQSEIKTILSAHGKKTSFSLRGPDGKELFHLNGDLALAPASIAKTVSTGCSLRAVGPQFQFETLFGYRGKIVGDKLEGDLVIRGGGDPTLVIEDLREITEKLRFIYGIKSIHGNLVFDVSYFGTKSLPISEGFEGDNGRSFAADLTPTPMNQNSFSIWAAPNHREENEVIVSSLPNDLIDVKLINKVKIGGGNSLSVDYDVEKKRATVFGSIDSNAEPKSMYRSVADNYDYYYALMQKLWTNSGGEWRKTPYKIETKSVDMIVLWKHQSRSLAKILMDINKLSLNLGAELLFLNAGAQKKQWPASYEKSLGMLGECLHDLQIPEGGIHLTNASGLSRQATIKTSALTKFLFEMSKSNFAPEYLSSFSLMGIDGTTKSRLPESAGRVRVKTGSIKGVRSIAGYLYKNHQPFTFALILNGIDPSDASVKKSEDQIIAKVLEE